MAVLTLLFALVLPATAASGGTAKVTSAGGVSPGQTITFTVKISGSKPLRAAMITPIFDTDVFELVSGSFLRSGVMADFSGGDGVIAWSEPTDVNGDLLKFVLKAKDTAVVGKSYTVSCTYTVSNADDERETGTVKASTVTILCNHSFTVKSTDAKYRASGASCTAKAKYYYSCAHCGAAGTKTFETGELLKHEFTKKDTAAKYAKVESNCQTHGEYYFSCKLCGAKGDTTFVSDKLGDHVYDHGCDADCNLCGQTRTTTHAYSWASDKDLHWQECANCHAKGQTDTHIPGPEATDTEPQVCTVCQRELVPAKNHLHTFPEDWTYDDAGHWHQCACGNVEDLSVHSWGEKTVVKEATTDAEGILRSVCQICGAYRDEAIPKLPASQAVPVAQKASSVPVIVLAVLLAVSLIGNGVLIVLLTKKRK